MIINMLMRMMKNLSGFDITDQGLRLEEGTHGPSLLTIFNSSNIEDDVNRDTNHFQGPFSKRLQEILKCLFDALKD